MKRRDFMYLSAGAFLGSAPLSALHAKASKKKPNILFILADDCTFNLLSLYGGKDLSTPNINRIAREGMQFTRAYSCASMCAPFRAELYTGLYPVRNGVAWNHSKARPGTKSVCHHLGGLGYRVALSGKKHASPPSVFPFQDLKGFPAGPGIRSFVAKDAAKPFCLFLCSNNPHAPWTTGDASQFDADKISLAPIQHDNPPTREVMTRYLAEVSDLDREVGEILKMLDETGRAKDTLVMFSSEQGWALGFAKWSSWNLGVHTALLARWPGQIKPGSRTDAMVQICDILPTFIEAAGGDPSKKNLDGSSFLPVLKSESTKHRDHVYCLHNNVPEGRPYPIRSIFNREFHYLMNLGNAAAYHEKHVMVANSRLTWWPALEVAAKQGDKRAQKLMDKYQHRPTEELYRVADDPHEQNNLADKPQFADVKKQLRTELLRWMEEQKDPGAAMDTQAAYDTNRKSTPSPAPNTKGTNKNRAAKK